VNIFDNSMLLTGWFEYSFLILSNVSVYQFVLH